MSANPSADGVVSYVFGYGSLLNRGSIEKTLQCPIDTVELHVFELRNYARKWQLVESVVFDDDAAVRVHVLHEYPLPFFGLRSDTLQRTIGSMRLRHRSWNLRFFARRPRRLGRSVIPGGL